MNLRFRAQRQILKRTDMVSEISSSRMIRMLKVAIHKSTSNFEVGKVLTLPKQSLTSMVLSRACKSNSDLDRR